MVKHRRHKSQKACTSSVHKKGHFVEVKARCHVGKAKLMTPSACKHLPKSKRMTKRTKHTDVPPQCKGLKKKERKDCAKRICAQRPEPYKTDCLKAAGIRK